METERVRVEGEYIDRTDKPLIYEELVAVSRKSAEGVILAALEAGRDAERERCVGVIDALAKAQAGSSSGFQSALGAGMFMAKDALRTTEQPEESDD
jgi:hypothetical protein